MNGFENENQFKKELHNRNFDTLPNNLKNVILYITKNIKPEKPIIVLKSKIRHKSDLPLVIDNIEFNISIKKGSGNSIHQENIDDFIKYLENNFGSNIKVFKALRRYIWGDGTEDGSGKIIDRISSSIYKKKFPLEIDLLNKYFEEHELKLIERFVINGNFESKKIDFLIYGEITNCKIVSANAVTQFLINSIPKGTINVGGLTFQAWNRNLNGGQKSEKKRGQIQLKWGTLKSDIETIIENER